MDKTNLNIDGEMFSSLVDILPFPIGVLHCVRMVTGVSTSSTMSVDIQITYKAPPDFKFSSPPYYRPAGSVSLMCVVNGASGSV